MRFKSDYPRAQARLDCNLSGGRGICPNVRVEELRLALRKYGLQPIIAPGAAKLGGETQLKPRRSHNAATEVQPPLGNLIQNVVSIATCTTATLGLT